MMNLDVGGKRLGLFEDSIPEFMINLDVGGKWRGLEFTGSVRGKR
jgi:hypothetical protein